MAGTRSRDGQRTRVRGGVTNRPVVVITGASSGIGAVLAELLASRGMSVALVARRAGRYFDSLGTDPPARFK
jgi:NADPH:quinone reductase-like Zn-dependent oxidoreductase